MGRLRMAVIGVGHLGKEHARILAGLPEVELVGIADTNIDQAHAVARRLGTQAFQEYWPLLNLVDAATVAVPTSHHYSVASAFLRRGIPVLVEKPLALDGAEATALVELAELHRAVLLVGHIERFNPAFEDLLGRRLQPKFVACERLGTFTGRSTDIGVVLDLMIHDLDLLLALVQAPVIDVQAVGLSVFGRHEDVGHAWLRFANGCVAVVHASRVSCAPSRSMEVWAPEGFVRLDFNKRQVMLMQPSAEVREHGLDPMRLDAVSFARLKEDLFVKHLQVAQLDRNHGDQLTRELQHFVKCLQERHTPRVGGAAGRDAILLAQKVLGAMNQHRWEGRTDGPTGPTQLPPPIGPLFVPGEELVAA
jgi:predicted dehydrogenase